MQPLIQSLAVAKSRLQSTSLVTLLLPSTTPIHLVHKQLNSELNCKDALKTKHSIRRQCRNKTSILCGFDVVYFLSHPRNVSHQMSPGDDNQFVDRVDSDQK